MADTSFFALPGAPDPEPNVLSGLIDTINSQVNTATTAADTATNAASQATAAAATATGVANSVNDLVTLANETISTSQAGAATATTKASEAADSAAAAAASVASIGTAVGDSALSATAAANSATAAASSATNAASSATAAAGSASTASTQATNAAGSATSAGNSASSAATSATNAASSASSASSSASTATTQASAASTSASNAASSATSAASSASAASTSATNAASSASTASTAATNASTSATLAQDWATKTSAEVVTGQGYGAKKYAQDASTSASLASTSASNASTSATNAASSASSASTSASTATTQATNASNSASVAATSATNAASSASSASTSATSAAASLTAFKGQYYGSYSSDPTLDPNGAAIGAGDLYFNTASSVMKVYSGTSWQDVGKASISYFKFVATAGQTTFSGTDANSKTLSYTAGFIDVLVNGVELDFSDYTASNGTSIVLGTGLVAGDELRVRAYGTFTATDAVSKTGDTMTGNLTLPNLAFSGTGGRITGDFSNATVANRVAFQTSTANGVTSIDALPNGTSVAAVYRTYNNSDPTNAAYASVQVNASAAVYQSGVTGTGTYLPMTFYTGGSERVRIDTSGNVGIGTNSPAAKLHVVGNNGTNGTSAFFTTDGTGGVSVSGYSNVAYIQGQASANGTAVPLCLNQNGGNVGIGTSSPGTKLQVNGSFRSRTGTNENVTTQSSVFVAGGVLFNAYNDAVSAGTPLEFNGSSLQFGTGNAERARIDSSGQMWTTNGAGSVAKAYDARAWVNFNGTGTVAIRGSGNVTSITDNGVGSYTVNFTSAMPDTNYSMVGTCGGTAGASQTKEYETVARTSSAITIATITGNGASTIDAAQVNVSVFR